MIDSVLKGTGNSRFLKSAVPAGTSWADALAMLQAGTFPIDFNGINTEGFQQVGTPLNKANLLKDATAAQIGLPPSTTPDGMFQALGNTGELHVWRKTVTTAQEIPAGYTLGNTEENVLIASRETSYMAGALYYYYGNSITVSDNGNASNPASDSYEMIGRGYTTAKTILSGPVFVKCATDYISSSTGQQTAMPTKKGLSLFFIPSGGNLVVTVSDYPGNSSIKVVSVVATKYQLVNPYPLTPAGTTTTYPVSTNPKAYQEGDDAKAAGYVVGDAVTGDFILGQANASDAYLFYKASSPTVSDDGTIEFDKNHYIQIGYAENWTASTLQAAIRGQFLQRGNSMNLPSSYVPAGTIYIPNDAVVTRSNDNYIVSKYQPVTGYAAIHAGTTIEYLGKLGDKARVQVVSYVGTGTYGSDNPCSLTFDFPPKVVLFLRGYKKGSTQFNYLYGSYGSDSLVIVTADLSEEFTVYNGFGRYNNAYAKKDSTGRTISWYSYESANSQANATGCTHYFLAIG